MKKTFLKNALPVAIAATMGLAVPTMAQQTSSAIQGLVTDSSGNPLNDATVTVVHEPSNSQSNVTLGESGRFNVRGLRVGGPYSVTVESANGTRTVQDLYLTLGDAYQLQVVVGAATEEMIVVGNLQEQNYAAVGPNSTFSLEDLTSAPAINRDLKDLVRIDPRIYVDEAFVDSIQCAGANPRYNSLTVDGVRMNDNFGLNSNGYPTERMPFSYDAIEQVAVELAPFDVQYGGFSACNINAVTKSGENEFHGGIFYDYTDDSLGGDSLEGDPIDIAPFDEQRYGFNLSGPIIKDKLFFFAAYEKLEGVDTFDRGTADANVATPVEGVSAAQLAEIERIANDVYNYDPGTLPSSLPVEDEKLLIKLDWNITDSQRASFTYNYNDGFSIAQSDGDSNELEFSNHYYERGAELNSYVAQLFSDWSDNFSTEVKIGYQELDNRQLSLGGTEFGEVQITTYNDHDNDGSDSRATVYMGSDDSRHANKLTYENLNLKIAGSYRLDHQTWTLGYERESFDIFNMFIQEAEGEYRFDSIEDFAAGTPSRITYENAAGSNMKADAAAEFAYAINTLYLQDEIFLDSGNLRIVAGLRYDWYESDDVPTQNLDILESYFIDTRQNLDEADLLQPRLGFNWNISEAFEIHGGVGLYSGGNPNVWISNSYSNDGVTQIEVQDRSGDSVLDMDFSGEGRPIYDIPQNLYDAVANNEGSNGGVNLLDPNFEIPSVWKLAFGTSYEFGGDLVLSADILFSQYEDAAIVSDISRVQTGSSFDGRPIYGSIDGRSQDFMLTNVKGDSGEAITLSMGVSKYWDFGLETAFGYAYTDSEDVNPMTSSVAFSNYVNLATADPENPGTATSNYNIPHRFTTKIAFDHDFFGDYATRITLFGSANEGRPYSYTMDDGFVFGDSTGFIERHLLYVPTDVNDPNVVYGENFDVDAFYNLVDDEGLTRGQVMERNEIYSDWWIKFDLKVEQELPGIMDGHRSSIFMVIENFGNMLNDDWGVQYETSFPRAQTAVDFSMDDQGRYVYEEFRDPAGPTRVGRSSLWELRIGIKYDF
ncbi:TonB-dependent receptor [Gilvimarinus sp. SDUM040013]|uniref:TonB-dependent receptor n=1 Tax=Gilvimarinus gilvus TaxID=3058038 RepID=A0ABU4S1N5_9GAMM|nr:TonB-dependent receptor [Gilvimarinus sp. SDUM040013]MDO3386092.1 TonB-dependent receptor [Gilvimarinus sp. SDUM040013]MDX6850367.1 TonB-dependent receptor [Gilvimarinus sp. SDUM040013]